MSAAKAVIVNVKIIAMLNNYNINGCGWSIIDRPPTYDRTPTFVSI